MSDFTQQFIQDCLKTESKDFGKIRERLEDPQIRATLKFYLEEYIYFAEQLDVLKKLLFYGKLPQNEDFLFSKEYVSERDDKIHNTSDKNIRLLHAGLGIATESAEFLVPLLKHLYQNEMLDEVNLAEESLCDLAWYQSICADALGKTSFKEGFDKVVAKLKARYGEKFSDSAAVSRDLEKERKILES